MALNEVPFQLVVSQDVMFANVPQLHVQRLGQSWCLKAPCSRVYVRLLLFIAAKWYLAGPGERKSCLSTFRPGLAPWAPGRRLMEGRHSRLQPPHCPCLSLVLIESDAPSSVLEPSLLGRV